MCRLALEIGFHSQFLLTSVKSVQWDVMRGLLNKFDTVSRILGSGQVLQTLQPTREEPKSKAPEG